MTTVRFWFGVREYQEQEPVPCVAALQRSCKAGNFAAPHGRLGFWAEYDTEHPTVPWFRFASQGFEPRPKEWGEMSEDAAEKLRAAHPVPKGPKAPRIASAAIASSKPGSSSWAATASSEPNSGR
jgi:hypothetical protein